MQGSSDNELRAKFRCNCFFNRILAGMVQERGLKDFRLVMDKAESLEESRFGPPCGVGAGKQLVRYFAAVYGRLVEIWQNGHGCLCGPLNCEFGVNDDPRQVARYFGAHYQR